MPSKDNSVNFIGVAKGILGSYIEMGPRANAAEAPKKSEPLTKENIYDIVKSLHSSLGVVFRDHVERVEVRFAPNGRIIKTRSLGRFVDVSPIGEEAFRALLKEKFAEEIQ